MEETFIAYVGTEICEGDIEREFEEIINNSRSCDELTYRMQHDAKKHILFGKVVDDDYASYRDPQAVQHRLIVSGCDRNEISDVMKMSCYKKYSLTDDDYAWKLFAYLYSDHGEEMFSVLEPDLDYSVAIYDYDQNKLIVGRGNGEFGKEANLFYGFTRKKGDIVFSNNRKFLQKFCAEEVIPFPKGSYWVDGEFHTYLDETKIDEPTNPRFIKDSPAIARQLLEGLNAVLVGVTDESVKQKVEKNIEALIASDEHKEKIEKMLFDEIDEETKKAVVQAINASIDKINLDKTIEKELKKTYLKLFRSFVKDEGVPYVNVIKLKDVELGRTNAELFHEKFEEVLQLVQLDEPVMLIGPAGSGKNHSISQIARALGKPMYYTNNASNEFKLTGFIDAGGTYRDTQFYKAFKNGGIFFLDEIDNSDPSALIVINSALANGYMAFPHETIDRHPDFRMVAAANTWGKGSDLQYVGRNALDGATLDRFDNVFFDYDRKLESGLYPNEEVLKFMWSFRNAIDSAKIPHIVSTRGIGKVYRKELNGIATETILRTNVVRNLGQDDLNTIIGTMNDIDDRNKFYSTVRTLKIGK